MSERLELTLRNDLSELARLSAALERFGERAGLDRERLLKFNLVLDELVTNVVSYAWPEGGEHRLSLDIRCEDGRLRAELVDDGIPFNPLELPPPDVRAGLEHRAVGGLGVHFVRQLTDDIRYRREAGCNRLLMEKRL